VKVASDQAWASTAPPSRHAAPASRTLVLLYHTVHLTPEQWQAQRPAGRRYSVMANQFEAQMEYLARAGFQTSSLDDFLDGRSPARSVVITFDDGHESNLTVALPVLQRYGFRAEFFVTVSFVGQPRFMTWAQVKQLHQAGMSVQAHGLHHQPLTEVPREKLMEELRAAKERIEDQLNSPVNYLALPGGFANDRVYREAREAGYQAVCNSEPGIARRSTVIPRVAVMHSMAQTAFESVVERKFFPLLRMRAQREFGKAAKALLGLDRYEALKNLAMRSGPN